MGAIDESLRQIDFAAVSQVFSERLEHFPEHARLDPFLHPTMNRLIRRVFARQSLPRRTGPKDPEHAVEHASRGHTRATLAVLARLRMWDQRLDNAPLLVGELHVLFDHNCDHDAILLDHVLGKRSKSDHLPTLFLRCVLDSDRDDNAADFGGVFFG